MSRYVAIGGTGGAASNVVVHGTDPDVARPDVDGPVIWFGSVDPVHADDTRDVSIPVTEDGGDGFVELAVNDGEVAALVTGPSATRTAITALAAAQAPMRPLLVALPASVSIASATLVDVTDFKLTGLTPGLWSVELTGSVYNSAAMASYLSLVPADGLVATDSGSMLAAGSTGSGLLRSLRWGNGVTAYDHYSWLSATPGATFTINEVTGGHPFRAEIELLVTTAGSLQVRGKGSVASSFVIGQRAILRATKIV